MIRILIVDDQNLARQTVRDIVEAEFDFEVVGEADNGFEGLELIEATQPDLALVDLEMPEMDGFTLTKLVQQRFPQTKILILSGSDDEISINRAVQTGARGYLLKSNSREEIVEAIRCVQQGYFQLSPGLFEKLIFYFINNKDTASQQLVNFEEKYNNYCEQLEDEISDLEEKYRLNFAQLEQKIILTNENNRNELFNEIEEQINQIKVEFAMGLKTFQQQVNQQVQLGLDAFTSQHKNNQSNVENFENEIKQYNFEQQTFFNHQLISTQQSVKRIEKQIKLMGYCLIFFIINFIGSIFFSLLTN